MVAVASDEPGAPPSGSFLAQIEAACLSEGWLDAEIESSEHWLRIAFPGVPLPEQGWKLHVSAGISSAREVLAAALPVLLAARVTFKVAASLDTLMRTNEGEAGFSQVGKFITVYPYDDAQAVRIATALDRVTTDHSGPAVPSDRPLHRDSLVFYRYGGFRDLIVQSPTGLIGSAVRAVDGALVPDRRSTFFEPPIGRPSPFPGSGQAARAIGSRLVFKGRYIAAAVLATTPRGAVYRAIDPWSGARRVIKRARRGAMEDFSGRDARDRLRHEAAVLEALAGDPAVPALIESFEEDGDSFLVLEEIEGETALRLMQRLTMASRLPTTAEIIAWGRHLAGILVRLHQRGIIFRDMKPTNVLLTAAGVPRIVDFELASLPETDEFIPGAGSRGYASPEQLAGHPPAVTDDVYGLGALLYFLATGAEPSQSSDCSDLLRRPVRLLNPALGVGLAGVIEQCLDPDQQRRYQCMAAVAAALVREGVRTVVPSPAIGAEPRREPTPPAGHWRSLAHRLGDTLVRAAETSPDGREARWLSTHAITQGTPYRDLAMGSAGSLLALTEIAGQTGDPAHRQTVAAGAHWLRHSAPIADPPLPGLYMGEAGIGAALLRAGQLLSDRDLIAAAVERGRLVASLPFGSPELYVGTAGRLRFHLLLWDETGEPEHLADARACGESLLTITEHEDGLLFWPVPEAFTEISDRSTIGYAHGAAGIADALLDLFEATGDERYAEAVQQVVRRLTGLARPPANAAEGVAWPLGEGRDLNPAMWCHGAGGIGRFLVRAGRALNDRAAIQLARGAAQAVARSTRWANPTQCHGLSGSIECLLDVYQATGERAWLEEAYSLAAILEACAFEKDGMLVWPSESPGVITPDLLVGYAGVALCLLRLSDPDNAPHLLSRAGFRHPIGPRRLANGETGVSWAAPSL